jgi:hypothetical protein
MKKLRWGIGSACGGLKLKVGLPEIEALERTWGSERASPSDSRVAQAGAAAKERLECVGLRNNTDTSVLQWVSTGVHREVASEVKIDKVLWALQRTGDSWQGCEQRSKGELVCIRIVLAPVSKLGHVFYMVEAVPAMRLCGSGLESKCSSGEKCFLMGWIVCVRERCWDWEVHEEDSREACGESRRSSVLDMLGL